MFKQILEEIENAEKAAYNTRKSADEKAKKIISDALDEAKEICRAATESAEKEYQRAIGEAKKTAEASINEYRRISYENAAVVSEVAQKNTEKAILYIINAILDQKT